MVLEISPRRPKNTKITKAIMTISVDVLMMSNAVVTVIPSLSDRTYGHDADPYCCSGKQADYEADYEFNHPMPPLYTVLEVASMR